MPIGKPLVSDLKPVPADKLPELRIGPSAECIRDIREIERAMRRGAVQLMQNPIILD
ncbi:hypothetical protein KKD81_00270 [Patescibacteria group bacterium]|nr:hypothetical protein [Patescibacteria group bacterium]MBU2159229.1 hypothetical protein [Patescibacteria group bacterium]MBU2220354.1 hypothetical protein [Patescibacteria group bacterium]